MRILVATDLSPSAQTALDLVRTLAGRASRVRVVYAVEPITTVSIFAPTALLTLNEAAAAQAKVELDKIASSLKRPGVEVDAVVAEGRAADVILEEITTFAADVLVVGTRGRGGIVTSVLGSVSAELVDRAACPVLVARRTTLDRIVLAEDGSTAAAAGAQTIARLPIFSGKPVHVVSVVDVPFPVVFADPTGTGTAVDAYRAYEQSMPQLRATHAAYARERGADLAAKGFITTTEQREGDAASEIIEAAKAHDADCIVIGSRGQTGFRRFMVGSVARSVLFHSSCSVLIVHPSPVASGVREREPVEAATR